MLSICHLVPTGSNWLCSSFLVPFPHVRRIFHSRTGEENRRPETVVTGSSIVHKHSPSAIWDGKIKIHSTKSPNKRLVFIPCVHLGLSRCTETANPKVLWLLTMRKKRYSGKVFSLGQESNYTTTPHASSTLVVTSCCWAFIGMDKQPGRHKHPTLQQHVSFQECNLKEPHLKALCSALTNM